ncbi:M20/M25/M40 family metallo-hydrolase [Actinoplanes sp. NPDC049265]|uniref:M20/M25/M40 family metallo-hydrolase n=1 Tax=Actinoplanes sp. NPDC049265 TaxID=3363902 RepID=UPI00371AECFE
MRDAPGRALLRPRFRPLAALLALLVLAAVGVLAAWSIRPPAARGTSAPASEFSAGRAFQHVQAMSTTAHPAGSAANDKVRDYLVRTLRGDGLEPEIQDTVTEQGGQLSGSAGGIGMARVRNVIATIPGSESSGRVFLVAHYDSAQAGPGASDDLAGVSAILETVRALTSSGRTLRNDVVVVLTDAEEACLCGAEAFVKQHPLARDGGVALNLEARGTGGPAITFETSADDEKLIGVFAKAPHPVGTSFAVEVYRLLPNDTDFTPFRESGFRGLNTAYIDGAANYHAPTDTASRMDRDSLEHHGENALALVRAFGDEDLTDLEARSDATYFPVPGGLARYPGWLVWPIAVLALLAVLRLGASARKRGLTTRGKLWGGFLLGLLPLLVTPVLAQSLWQVVTIIRPAYTDLPIDPYRPLWFRAGVVAVVALVVFAWYALLRRRMTPAALTVGGLGWLAVLGVVLAYFAPGGSYLFALPALAGALMSLLAIAFRGGWGALLPVLIGAAVAVIVLAPAVILFFPALGLVLTAAAALLGAALALALLPLADLLHPASDGRARRLALLPSSLALLAIVGCGAAGLHTDKFDTGHPEPTHLMYALDTDTGSALWLSDESKPRPWTAQFVAGSKHAVTDTLPLFGAEKLLTGPAEAAELPAPQLTVVSDTREGSSRVLRLRLRSQRQVRLTALHVAASTDVTAASVNGRGIPTDGKAGGAWGFGFVFNAPPPEGLDVVLRLATPGQVRLRAVDGSDGLSGLPGFRPRPADVGVVGSHSSELLAVAKTFTY